MAITTADGLVAAARQTIPFYKGTSFTTVASNWFSLLDVAGIPGAGSLAVGDTSAGLVPTDATAGFPLVDAFGGGATGYLASVAFGGSVACRVALKDRLYHAGSFACTSLTTFTLASQPSATGRMPDAAGVGCEIWVEINAAMAASATTVTVTYTNAAGTTGRSTASSGSLSSFTTRRLVPLSLQAGDTGVQKIESVIIGGATNSTGTVNVIIARPLWQGRVVAANAGDVHSFDKTGLVRVYDTSALWALISADSTSSGVPEMLATVVNG